MFPPSPNSSALFAQMQSGGATPSTLDFHRTAMNAAAAQKRNEITSQPQDIMNGMDMKPAQNGQGEVFGQHDANDAANGLFLLASQSRNGSQGANQSVLDADTTYSWSLYARHFAHNADPKPKRIS